jgi:stearoyl-CoA desaturase (delta-9 desaturase)
MASSCITPTEPQLEDRDASSAISIDSNETPKNIKNPESFAWPTIMWLVGLHILSLAAPFTFTWQAALVTVFLYWLAGSIGICLGYHRLLTHSGFKTYAPVRWAVATIGCLAGEGSPIDWVANHRKHHAHSDHEGDPHSPREGGWWAHMFWLAYGFHGKDQEDHVRRWAPDLAKDPAIRFISRMFIPINFVAGVILAAFGYWLGGTSMAVSMVVWGVFLRLTLVLHSTWLVNSATHMWGYRNYTTTDDSRNLWWVAMLTHGEGWHNNHHAYPRMAVHGHKWWEIDITYAAIRCLRAIGCAWDVIDYKHRNDVEEPAKAA